MATRNGAEDMNTPRRKESIADCKTDYERALLFLSDKDAIAEIDEWFEKNKADDDTLVKKHRSGELHLKLANDAVAEKNTDYALSTFAVVLRNSPRLPANSTKNFKKTLALAFFGRSSVYFSLQKYEYCILDCDMALENGYPVDLQHKLYLMKGNAHSALKQNAKALECFEKAMNLFEDLKREKKYVDAELLKYLHKTVANLKPKIASQETKDDSRGSVPVAQAKKKKKCKYDCLGEICSDIQCGLAQRIECKKTEHTGRGLFAKRDFEYLDVVFSDKAWASTLGSQFYESKCYYCLATLDYSLPCDHCSLVMFCNKTCKEKGWREIHRFDCGITVKIFIRPQHRMAYEIFARTPWATVKDIALEDLSRGNLLGDAYKIEDIDIDISNAQNYRSIYYLDPSFNNLSKYKIVELYEDCYKLLRFYEHKLSASADLSDDLGDMTVAPSAGCFVFGRPLDERALRLAVLARHTQQSLFHNMSCIPVMTTHQGVPCNRYSYNEMPRYNLRMFPVGALLNNSCERTVQAQFSISVDGDVVDFVAMKRIRRGDELTISYEEGRSFDLQKKSLYCECKCKLCSLAGKGWTKKQMVDTNFEIDGRILYCEICFKDIRNTVAPSFLCGSCFKNCDVQDIIAIEGAYEQLIRAGDTYVRENFKRAIQYLNKCCELREGVKTGSPSSCILLQAYYHYSVIYRTIGKFTKALDYVRKTLDYYEGCPAFKDYNITKLHFGQALALYKELRGVHDPKYLKKIRLELQMVCSVLIASGYFPKGSIDLDFIITMHMVAATGVNPVLFS